MANAGGMNEGFVFALLGDSRKPMTRETQDFWLKRPDVERLLLQMGSFQSPSRRKTISRKRLVGDR